MGLFKKIGEAIVGAVKDVVTAPFKIAKEAVELTGNLLEGDFKGAFKDLTEMVGPALTVVSTVGTFGAGGIALNLGKQAAISGLKNIAIRAGGDVLGTVLGEAGVKGPVAQALVGTAQSFAGGGFKIDVETAAKTMGKAALGAAAETDGTLGDIAKVANVAAAAATAAGGDDGDGFKLANLKLNNIKADEVVELATEVGQTGVAGEEIENIAHLTAAVRGTRDAAKDDDGLKTGEVLEELRTLGASGALGAEAQQATALLTNVISTVNGAREDGLDAADLLTTVNAVAANGLLGEEVQRASLMINGGIEHLNAVGEDGIQARDILQTALILAQSQAQDEDLQKVAVAVNQLITHANAAVEDGVQAREVLQAAMLLADAGVVGEDLQRASLLVGSMTSGAREVVRDGITVRNLLDAMLTASAQQAQTAEQAQIMTAAAAPDAEPIDLLRYINSPQATELGRVLATVQYISTTFSNTDDPEDAGIQIAA